MSVTVANLVGTGNDNLVGDGNLVGSGSLVRNDISSCATVSSSVTVTSSVMVIARSTLTPRKYHMGETEGRDMHCVRIPAEKAEAEKLW